MTMSCLRLLYDPWRPDQREECRRLETELNEIKKKKENQIANNSYLSDKANAIWQGFIQIEQVVWGDIVRGCTLTSSR